MGAIGIGKVREQLFLRNIDIDCIYICNTFFSRQTAVIMASSARDCRGWLEMPAENPLRDTELSFGYFHLLYAASSLSLDSIYKGPDKRHSLLIAHDGINAFFSCFYTCIYEKRSVFPLSFHLKWRSFSFSLTTLLQIGYNYLDFPVKTNITHSRNAQ